LQELEDILTKHNTTKLIIDYDPIILFTEIQSNLCSLIEYENKLIKVERYVVLKPTSPSIHRVLMIKLDKQVDKSRFRYRFFEVMLPTDQSLDQNNLKHQSIKALQMLFEHNQE